MHNAKTRFEVRINEIKALGEVYEYLENQVAGGVDYTDILRSMVVYSISAYDALLHDLIRIGMAQAYLGQRSRTAKYAAEGLSLSEHRNLATTQIPPPESLFEEIIRRKHKYLSFQDPDKVCDGLSLIWDEKQKWQKIADRLGAEASSLKIQQKLFVGRRNAIVHEYDHDPLSNNRQAIDRTLADEIVNFFLLGGVAIAELVT